MTLRDTVIEIDLKALAHNMDAIRAMVGKEVAVMPVIKANAYGLGAVGVAPTLIAHGARYLAVATLSEAMELRAAYPDAPLFILGHTPDRLLPVVVKTALHKQYSLQPRLKRFQMQPQDLAQKQRCILRSIPASTGSARIT